MALTAIRPMNDMFAPQLGAVSYGNAPVPRYEDYVESMASRLPEIEAADYARQVQEEQLRLEREARDQMRRDANVALGINTVKTGAELAANPVVHKYGAKVWGALTPKPPAATTPMMPSYATESVATTAPSYAAEPLQNATPATNVLQPIASTADVANKPFYAPVTEFKGGFQRIGEATGMNPTAASGLATLGTAAVNYGIEKSNVGDFMHKTVGGGKREWTDAATSLTSFALGGPVGLGLNLAGIGIREFGKKNCIIVTAATDGDEYSIEIAREFRDKFMDRESRVGYYYLADRIVPLIENNEELKAYVRESLVEPLIRYGEWKLNHKKEHPSVMDYCVTKNFLAMCRDCGVILKTYTRSNGEVI